MVFQHIVWAAAAAAPPFCRAAAGAKAGKPHTSSLQIGYQCRYVDYEGRPGTERDRDQVAGPEQINDGVGTNLCDSNIHQI